ncbi:plasmid stabilization system protein [Caulobacter sp. AP07]|uniref:type II toxin-antitoxin system RelE/ParE family toxin n=1 Tax=Caulobacter sp. AP07 TaxID=1144304 RepID=UPI0002720678|nr:type II toxin-antitoxin system RelE/ParE family toxin [Caulobacter sp. AP07]EJL37102.1 plasmid stabilization system protein [Caulobacter sp. AP07]
MKPVEFGPRARRDLIKLRRWLVNRAPSATNRAIDLILERASQLAEYSDLGRRKTHGMRELYVPFGAHAYVLQYRVERDAVVIVRIRHGLERR